MNNFEKYINVLKHNPLFNNITIDDIPIMLNRLHAYTKSYKKEEYIKHSGDNADFIGILLSGKIHILQDDYYGNRNITASISEGALFAEAFACADIKQLNLDIVAADNCTVMFLDSSTMLGSCNHTCKFHHTIVKNLLGIVANKNMYLNQKLRYMSRKTTSKKVMAYLYEQAKLTDSNEFTIPFNRQELADYLGVERSAMSVEISKLVKLGIIETKRSYFKILE